MNILEVKKIFEEIIFSSAGIVKIESISDTLESEDKLIVLQTSKGWSFKVGLIILQDVSSKLLINEIFQRLTFCLEKYNQKIDSFEIFIKGVSDE